MIAPLVLASAMLGQSFATRTHGDGWKHITGPPKAKAEARRKAQHAAWLKREREVQTLLAKMQQQPLPCPCLSHMIRRGGFL